MWIIFSNLPFPVFPISKCKPSGDVHLSVLTPDNIESAIIEWHFQRAVLVKLDPVVEAEDPPEYSQGQCIPV
jgi:hypothetical protein